MIEQLTTLLENQNLLSSLESELAIAIGFGIFVGFCLIIFLVAFAIVVFRLACYIGISIKSFICSVVEHKEE